MGILILKILKKVIMIEDFTDWAKSDFGIKNLKSVKEILENL